MKPFRHLTFHNSIIYGCLQCQLNAADERLQLFPSKSLEQRQFYQWINAGRLVMNKKPFQIERVLFQNGMH